MFVCVCYGALVQFLNMHHYLVGVRNAGQAGLCRRFKFISVVSFISSYLNFGWRGDFVFFIADSFRRNIMTSRRTGD